MAHSPDGQLSLTEPDSRAMRWSGKGTATVGYNLQCAVDAARHIIVEQEVTNDGSDKHPLYVMAKRTQETLVTEDLTTVCDRGYRKGADIKRCAEAGITTYLPKPQASKAQSAGRLGKRDLAYHAGSNEYQCPAGERLTYRFTNVRRGVHQRRYRTRAGLTDSLKESCTKGQRRCHRRARRRRRQRRTGPGHRRHPSSPGPVCRRGGGRTDIARV